MEHLIYLMNENELQLTRVIPIQHPVQSMYKAIFQDGYENLFYCDVESGEWVEEDLGKTALASILGEKMLRLYGNHCTQPLSWCRVSIAGMPVQFGFYIFSQAGRTCCNVYNDNRKFLCSLIKARKNGRWLLPEDNNEDTRQVINKVQIIIGILNELIE